MNSGTLYGYRNNKKVVEWHMIKIGGVGDIMPRCLHVGSPGPCTNNDMLNVLMYYCRVA